MLKVLGGDYEISNGDSYPLYKSAIWERPSRPEKRTITPEAIAEFMDENILA